MQAKKILLYYPPNYRSVAIETICKVIKDAGHTIMMLTLTSKGELHRELEKLGIESFVYTVNRRPTTAYFIKHARFLARFCKKHKIDTIWSHLQEANFITVLAAPFILAKAIVVRHHDESSFYAQYGKLYGMTRNKKEFFLDRFINRFAKKIVVLSNQVRDTMIKYENCNPNKITVCPLIYDFSKYPRPVADRVNEIRREANACLLLIMVSRMIESKQHLLVFEVVRQLVKENYSIKLLVMDDGPLRPRLENFIKEHNLEEFIIMPGFRPDIINYMAAADLLMHPSLTEASSNVVKEMGLLKKAVAVCRGVGDFDDYIREGENGYILERERLRETVEKSIRSAYDHPETSIAFGENLCEKVLTLFSDSVQNRQHYLQLI